LRPFIKVQTESSSAPFFPRQPSAPLCFCATKNPTHVNCKLRHFLILNEKIALAPSHVFIPGRLLTHRYHKKIEFTACPA
jgi:hypothetical protein